MNRAEKRRCDRGTLGAPARDVDGAILFGCSIALGAVATVAPAEVALAAAAMAWLLGGGGDRSWRRTVSVAGVAALGLAAGACRAERAVGRHEAAREEAARVLGPPQRCVARATVASSPVKVTRARAGTSTTAGPDDEALRWDAELDSVACGDDLLPVAWRGRVTLYSSAPADLARGDEAEIVANLAAPQRFWNEASGDPRPGEARRAIVRTGAALDVRITRRGRGILAWTDRVRARVRARIDATFPADTAPMARALVLGESDLTAADDSAFRASGLAHLLAVSGMHLVIVVLGAMAALRALLVRIESVAARVDVGRLAAATAIPLAWLYAELAGASGSTLRAAWMLSAALLARALGRRTDGPRAFGLSILAMALADPLVAFDASFLLSAAATAGLLALAAPLAETLSRSRVVARWPGLLTPIARSTATTLAATIPCAPILARFAPAVPLGGVLANVLAVPLGEMLALPLCLLHAVLADWPDAERGAAVVASGALVAVRGIARFFAGLSALSVDVPPPTAWQVVALAVAAAALFYRRGIARQSAVLVAASVFLAAELRARAEGAPRGVLRATFLDVGQGDAAIVDLPNGEAIVIDGGGLVGSPIDVGARVLAPALRARRRGAVAAAVLSHPHPDHYSGMLAGLARVDVGALWDTGQGQREGVGGVYASLLAEARARGTKLVGPAALCGEREIGGARVEVLAPCPGPALDRGANDNSFVLRISYGQRSFLFVGDAEHDEEQELLASAGARLRADVLKVGHHGSRTSSSAAFLAAVAPREAVISVGARNRFGHPHPRALGALEASLARIWRTDRDGAVVATTDGTSLDVRAVGR